MKLTDQWFGLTYVQIAVAVLVAVSGDRERADRFHHGPAARNRRAARGGWIAAADPAHSVDGAAAIGLIGLALGLGLGAMQPLLHVEIARRDLIGIEIGYAYPLMMALALTPVILSAAFLASIGSGGERGARDRWWRHSNMNNNGMRSITVAPRRRFRNATVMERVVALVLIASPLLAQDARSIIAKAQKRSYSSTAV